MKSILQQVIEFPTPAVLEKFSYVLGLLHSKTDNWTLLGYYDFTYACSANFIPRKEEYHRSNHFSSSIVFYNLIWSVRILICFMLVTIKIYKNDNVVLLHLNFEPVNSSFTNFFCNNACYGKYFMKWNVFCISVPDRIKL